VGLREENLVRILTVDFIDPSPDFPIYMMDWDNKGRTTVEFLDRGLKRKRIRGLRFATWFLMDPSGADKLEGDQL
jgi:hypothetical protein